MYIKGVKKANRYVCGPQTIRHLGERCRKHIENYPGIDTIDEITEAGECTGWWKLIDYLCAKGCLTTITDIGGQAESFYRKLSRNHSENVEEWETRFELTEKKLLKTLNLFEKEQKLSESAALMPPVLRTWWFLRQSRLGPDDRAQLMAQTKGSYEWKEVLRLMKVRFPADVIKEYDKHKRDWKNSFVEEGAEEAALVEEFEQIMALDDGAESSATVPSNWTGEVTMDDAIFALRDRARGYREARDLMRKVRVARDFYPVVVPREDADSDASSETPSRPERRPRSPSPGDKGRGRGEDRGRRDRGRERGGG